MLGVLCLAVLVVGLDITVLNVALPTIASALDASTAELQWIVDAYVLAFAGAMLPAGLLGDRLGRRRMLLAGMAPVRRRLGVVGARGLRRRADRRARRDGRRRGGDHAARDRLRARHLPARRAAAGDRD